MQVSTGKESGAFFEPTDCGECGYSLTGLPASGKCPQCGTAYDSRELILFGKSKKWGHRGRWISPICFMLLMLPPLFSGSASRAFKIEIVSAISFMFCSTIWSLRPTPFRGPVQVRFSSAGAAQVDVRDIKHPIREWVTPSPWEGLTLKKWKLKPGGKLHVRFRRRFLHWLTAAPVDAELECSPELAEKLYLQMEAWELDRLKEFADRWYPSY